MASRKLVQNVQLTLTVANAESAAAVAQRIATSRGGFVQDVQIQRDSGRPRAMLTLRVPATALDSVVQQVRALARRVESESRNTEDITSQYVDFDARLRILRVAEGELLVLLRESRGRGGKAEDIMAVYRELTGIRTQIESLEARLRSMDQLAALATVRVHLEPDEATAPIVAKAWRPLETARASVRGLLASLQGLLDLVIFLVIAVAPVVALVGIPVILVVRRVRRRSRT